MNVLPDLTERPCACRVSDGVGLLFTLVLVWHYATGQGGPVQLVVLMVPGALVVVLWRDLAENRFYPSLPVRWQYSAAIVQSVMVAGAAWYLVSELSAIRIDRLGGWNWMDHLAAGVLVLLILEHCRRKYFPVFVVNLLLVLYCLLGPWVPGLFRHPGMAPVRVSSAFGLEMTTGIFERLPQLGLTLIGAFLLLLAMFHGFGAIQALLGVSQRMARGHGRLLPQAAILGSMGVGAVSGSGAANAATTGAATIPLLMQAGFSPVRAAAIETSASLGGQLLPPLMGISAFLMADFLGVHYLEVMARGIVPALVYFLGLAFAVHLWSANVRFPASSVESGVVSAVGGRGERNLWPLLLYGWVMVGLVVAMAGFKQPAITAAWWVFWPAASLLSLVTVVRAWRGGGSVAAALGARWLVTSRQFSQTTADLTILLAALGILTAAFTITGVPDKVGTLLMELAGVNVAAMLVAAFFFGCLIGMGLPVAPTYLVLVVVTAPFLVRAGLDPWAVHFFAFLVAIFGELTPPTSVTAAVTSRIANASFLKTMVCAVGISVPLFVLITAVAVRPELVAGSGDERFTTGIWVLLATLGLAAALHGQRFGMVWRSVFAVVSVVILLDPVPWAAAAGAGLLGWGILRNKSHL